MLVLCSNIIIIVKSLLVNGSDLFSAANIFLKLRDDLTVSARRKRLF